MSGSDFDIRKISETMPASYGRRSPLIVWMVENHDEFAAFAKKHRPDWDALTQQFTEAGLVSRSSKPLNPETVRTYWKRARALVARQRVEARASTQPPSPATPDVPNTPATPASPEPRFKIAVPHDAHLWSGDPGRPPAAKPAQAPNPAYAGLTPEQIADKVLGRKPKEPSK
jgi:hypothetical protein